LGVDDGELLGADAVHPAARATPTASAVARPAHLPFRAFAMAQSFHLRAAPLAQFDGPTWAGDARVVASGVCGDGADGLLG